MANLSMSKEGGEKDQGLPAPSARRPSVSNGGISRKNSLKNGGGSRRGSSPALTPFLAKFDEFTGEGDRMEKICCIGSGSWGTALARLAAQNAAEKDG
jgi:glycerol-3-phosphate dehydrogenase (NAD+)